MSNNQCSAEQREVSVSPWELASRKSYRHAAMSCLLGDMDRFTNGNVCLAGSFALAMYLSSRGVEVRWESNDIDVFFLAADETLRTTLLVVTQAYFESWYQDSDQDHASAVNVDVGFSGYPRSGDFVDDAEAEPAVCEWREKLSLLVSKQSAVKQTCAAT